MMFLIVFKMKSKKATIVRLVEAVVNGVSLWRVYVNMQLTRVFASEEEAKKWIDEITGNHVSL